VKPPNPKHSTGKPYNPLQGFWCDHVGYTISETGNVRVHGKRHGKQIVKFCRPEDLANLLWYYLKRK